MLALVYPPAVLSRLAHAWIFGTATTGLVVFLGTVLVFEILVSRRFWCRTMCPGGALYALIGWPRLLRVRLDPARCTGCRLCEPACEPGLNPVLESSGMECDNCGACVKACPEEALGYFVTVSGRSSAGPQSRAPNPGPLVVLALLATLVTPGPGWAHHILGLPHYAYKESYPQRPVLEHAAATGSYDLLLTSYPGVPVPGEMATIALYIRNRDTGRPYASPVGVRVLGPALFGERAVLTGPRVLEPHEVPLKLMVTFSGEGEHVIEITMDVDGQPEVIPFPLIVGRSGGGLGFLLASGGGLALLAIVVRAVRIKRERRRRRTARSPSRGVRPATADARTQLPAP
jgi:ferredoxin